MIAFTGVLNSYHKILVIKYKYVCALSFFVAICYMLWIYLYLPVSPESRTFLVGAYVFIIRLLAALFWGSATWFVDRYFRRRKLSNQTEDGSDGL